MACVLFTSLPALGTFTRMASSKAFFHTYWFQNTYLGGSTFNLGCSGLMRARQVIEKKELKKELPIEQPRALVMEHDGIISFNWFIPSFS